MLQASTSPRITLEFQNCTREDWLKWNLAGIKSELAGLEKFTGEAEAWKVVDVEEEGGKEVVAGVAIWGWSGRVWSAI
jgi:hypothetical protein